MRWTVVTALALLLLAIAGPAWGHASLVESRPTDREALEVAPEEVRLTFSEPVELPTAGLRVFDAEAERIDLGAIETDDPSVVAVALPDDLPDGGYVVTYRVISADSHPVGGVRTFTVGTGAEVADDVVAGLTAEGSGSAALRIGQVVRGLGYLLLLTAAGAALFAWRVAGSDHERGTAGLIARRAAVIGAGLALVAIPVQAVAVTGEPSAAVAVVPLAETAASNLGVSLLLRTLLLGGMVLALLAAVPRVLPVALGGLAVLTPVLDGHQRSVEPAWLLMSADAVHLLAAATWVGGLVVLAVLLRRPGAARDPVAAAATVARFSRLALVSVGLVAVAGVAMAVPLVGTPAALTGTTYGRVLLAKLGAVALVVAVAAYNRQRLVPAITAAVVPRGAAVDAAPGPDAERIRVRAAAGWRQLARTLRIEVALVAVVLLVTGVLATTLPASQAAGFGGVYEVTTPLGEDLELDLVVDPSVAGRNTIHLYVLDDTGRPSSAVEDLRLELTFVPAGIGPIGVEPFFAGPGHWIATLDDLSFPGDWEVRVVGGLDRFSEVETTVTVPVAEP